MRKLYQPESSDLTVPYKPDQQTHITENPPRFSWMPAKLEEIKYVLQISVSEHFNDQDTWTFTDIDYNYYTPDQIFQPNVYCWRYALNDSDGQSEWSQVRTFILNEHLPNTPLLNKTTRYDHAWDYHPRLWMGKDEIHNFRKELKRDEDHCGWKSFVEQSVMPWMERDLISEPERYPNNKRVADLWRKMYMDCQEVLYAIRHLSVAGVLLDNGDFIQRAKKWLIHVLNWDVNGTTSRDYNDEAAFRIAGAIAWGYDWLYVHLDEDERSKACDVLFERTNQVAFHVIKRSKIHQIPFDSHAVRSLSSVLIPCSISLLNVRPEAREWLDYAVEYFSGLYTPWGGIDGGWAEGPMYWTTQMAFATEAFNLLRKYTGINLYSRPFFQKTGDFPLYCYSPDTVRTSFGDQSNLGERPGLKTAFNIRQYAGLTGNGWYQWYYEQVKGYDTHPEDKFYNYGWWDFQFDDMVYRHDYKEIDAVEPELIEPVKWFQDVGWVAFHHNMHHPDKHLMLLAKSSSFGSISHSHGDQNGFLLHAYGEPLAIESGHYVAFNSSMHMEWRRQTRSTNNVLIDEIGQYAGTNKVLQKAASGVVEEVRTEEHYNYVRMNATKAYRENVPYLNQIVREIYVVQQSYVVIVDHIDLEQEGTISWLFHTPYMLQLSDQNFKVNGKKADMTGQFIYSSSGDLSLTQTNEYKGVLPEEIEGLPCDWHLTATSKKAKKHRIATLLVPFPKEEDKYVNYFVDDQDHGVSIYLTDQGCTIRVEVPKDY